MTGDGRRPEDTNSNSNSERQGRYLQKAPDSALSCIVIDIDIYVEMQRKNIKNNKPDSEPCVWGSKCLIAGDVNFSLGAKEEERKRRG